MTPRLRLGVIAAIAVLLADQASKLWLLLSFDIAGRRAVRVLAMWMARAHTRMAPVALGLIIGGAIGNAIDRLAWGAVVDFAHFHVRFGEKDFSWYVFTLADPAIVVGVAALLYDSLFGEPAVK